MNVQLTSDIHLEFHRDQGVSFIASLDPVGVDVLVLAGDIGNFVTFADSLERIAARYPAVVYVAGNHEGYGGSMPEVLERAERVAEKAGNIHVLENRVVDIAGVTFAGTSLWFPDGPMNAVYEDQLNDFHHIRGFKAWVYEANRQAIAFLHREAGNADVLITHHIPSQACVSPQWRGSEPNRFFVCPIAEQLTALPPLWFFGHTHDPFDAELGGCRFVANPFGYPREPKAGYQDKLVFEVVG